jgi:uncharacterized membrane protein
MVRSGLIFGALSLVFIFGFAVLVAPFCAPCIGLILGLAAGYVAGAFDKPADSGSSIKKGAGAGAIAGAIGLLGGLIGAVINGVLLNPGNVQSFTQMLGFSNINVSKAQIWATQLGIGFCIGLFDIAWMAVLGLVGGALWYQISGRNRTTVLPPQQPMPPQEPLPPAV